MFRFRDEHGMVAVYDFTLENKETYGFNDLCALYGRMKALRPDEGTTYLVCVNKKAGDILTDSMERNFGTCKNFRTFEEEETAWA